MKYYFKRNGFVPYINNVLEFCNIRYR